MSSLDTKWAVSWLDKNLNEPFDQHSPLCSRVNVGLCVKHIRCHDMTRDDLNSPSNLAFARLLAYNDDLVLLGVDDWGKDKVEMVEMDRAKFEKDYIGD